MTLVICTTMPRGGYAMPIRVGVIAPLRDVLAPTDVDGAYAVQTINTRFWEAQGRRIVGRKAGLTAKAVQVQLGVDQPDFGVLFEDMRVADGGALDPAQTLQPKAEAEIAFVLGADLPDPATTVEQVAAAVATRPRRDRDRRQPHRRLEDQLCRHGGRQWLVGVLRAGRDRAAARPASTSKARRWK